MNRRNQRGRTARPPALARALLLALLPPEAREVVVGDLDEEFVERVLPTRGRHRARLWYWSQALRSVPGAWRRGGPRAPQWVLAEVGQDLAHGVRGIVRRPGFTLVVVSTLALGIGSNVALYSVVDGVLLRPLDLPDAGRLVIVREEVSGQMRSLSGPNLADLEAGSRGVFAAMAGYASSSATIENPDGTREIQAGVGATPAVFEALGVGMQLGRPWGPEAQGTGMVSTVVLTDRLWRRRFGADPGVVGGVILLDGAPVHVSGILPRGFTFPTLETADFIHPLVTDPADLQRDGAGAFGVIARLADNVSVETARSRVDAAWASLRDAYPAALGAAGITVVDLQRYLVREVRPGLLALLGATALLLLLACANVTSLLLARGATRGGELALRASLGAGRARLLTQLSAEGILLAGLAGLVGTGLAEGALTVLRRWAPPGIPRLTAAHLDPRAIAVAVTLSLLCSVAVGLLPGLRATGPTMLRGLRDASGRTTRDLRVRRLQAALVVGQIAMAMVLATSAVLLLRSFAVLSGVDPGYTTAGVLTARLAVPDELYRDGAGRAELFRRAEREVRAIPGVLAVGTTLRAPFSAGRLSFPIRLEGAAPSPDPDGIPRAELGIVSGGYLDALRIPVLVGRNFGPEDGPAGARVALISSGLARTLYGEEDPVGRRVAPVLGDDASATDWAKIVGVVGDIRLQGLDAETQGTLYLSYRQRPQPFGTMVARVQGDPARLVPVLRDALLRVEPKLPVPDVVALTDTRSESLARPRFDAGLLALFALLALILAGVGIFGLLAYSVQTRRRELGVRIAFGARRSGVIRLVLAEGIRLTGLGIGLGLVAGLGAGRALAGTLFGVEATDALTYAAAAACVAAIAAAGCVVPALRASEADPIESLRRE